MRRRPALIAASAGITLLAATGLTGCGAVDKALGCAKTALTVAEAAEDLEQAASSASEDPQEAEKALDRIDTSLEKIDEGTGDTDVEKAVDRLQNAVSDAHTSVEEGKPVSVAPVGEAADELSQVCTPD